MNVRSKVIRKVTITGTSWLPGGGFIFRTAGPAFVHLGGGTIGLGRFLGFLGFFAVVREGNQRVGRPGATVARSDKAALGAAIVHGDSAAVIHGSCGGCGTAVCAEIESVVVFGSRGCDFDFLLYHLQLVPYGERTDRT